jgi:hypothetical protein
MTSDAVPAVGDPRRLLTEARDLARRVRVARRVTWLPLLALAVVSFGAIPVYLLGRWSVSDCRAVAGGEVCRAWFPAGEIYWLVALAAAYAVIAAGYLRVARARGVDTRVLPYAVTGIAISLLVFGAISAGAASWIFPDEKAGALLHPSWSVEVLFRLLAPTGGMGIALLVLAWLERHVALLLFAVGYLVVVLVPVDLGWEGPSQWQFVPMLVIGGGVLLLGGAGFALAQRLRRSR